MIQRDEKYPWTAITVLFIAPKKVFCITPVAPQRRSRRATATRISWKPTPSTCALKHCTVADRKCLRNWMRYSFPPFVGTYLILCVGSISSPSSSVRKDWGQQGTVFEQLSATKYIFAKHYSNPQAKTSIYDFNVIFTCLLFMCCTHSIYFDFFAFLIFLPFAFLFEFLFRYRLLA